MPLRIRPETTGDVDAVRQINDRAFGQPDEGRLVDALRGEGYARVSLVAEMDEQAVGHILFSELSIRSASGCVRALSLAPMAVLPEWQRQGIGSELVRHGLEACRRLGHPLVIVVGHPNFYPRFGFSAALAAHLETPFAGDAFMAVELTPGAMHGVQGSVEYPPPFDALT